MKASDEHHYAAAGEGSTDADVVELGPSPDREPPGPVDLGPEHPVAAARSPPRLSRRRPDIRPLLAALR
jgi:hypothetical protein